MSNAQLANDLRELWENLWADLSKLRELAELTREKFIADTAVNHLSCALEGVGELMDRAEFSVQQEEVQEP